MSKVLVFDNALRPDHAKYNKAKRISGRRISISFTRDYLAMLRFDGLEQAKT